MALCLYEQLHYLQHCPSKQACFSHKFKCSLVVCSSTVLVRVKLGCMIMPNFLITPRIVDRWFLMVLAVPFRRLGFVSGQGHLFGQSLKKRPFNNVVLYMLRCQQWKKKNVYNSVVLSFLVLSFCTLAMLPIFLCSK